MRQAKDSKVHAGVVGSQDMAVQLAREQECYERGLHELSQEETIYEQCPRTRKIDEIQVYQNVVQLWEVPAVRQKIKL